jgi:succinate dehydrogenase hydrophobic membrane anchor protein
MRYAEVLTQQTRRVISVDALRGFSFIWILGGDGAVWALAGMLHGQNSPALRNLGDFLGRELHHARWQGLTFYDFIFPLFIFITGISIVLALPKLVEREGSRAAHLHVIRRGLLLYGLGLIFYGGIENGWGDLRLLGVLQRIGICYLAAALLFLNVNVRALIATFVALLSLFYHAWVGIRDIWMDYVKPVGLRLTLQALTILWLVACAGYAAQILWRV